MTEPYGHKKRKLIKPFLLKALTHLRSSWEAVSLQLQWIRHNGREKPFAHQVMKKKNLSLITE